MKLYITGEWKNHQALAEQTICKAAKAVHVSLNEVLVILHTKKVNRNWTGRAWMNLYKARIRNKWLKCKAKVVINSKVDADILQEAAIHELAHIAYSNRSKKQNWHGRVFKRIVAKATAICGKSE